MNNCQANVPTEHAVSYLKQLCRHWSHKHTVEFTDEQGRIDLPGGLCLLHAEPTLLNVRLEIKECGDMSRMQTVVAEHLQRFGFREQLVFAWEPA